MQLAPIDIVEIIKAVFFGVAGLCIPLATVYIMITAHRTKELNTKIDGMLVDRDASNVRKGERKGEDKADTLAEGQRQGRETERASSIARGLENSGDRPLPVQDEAAAKIATESAEIALRTAEATEKGAKAQQDIAKATERKS